MPLTATEPRRHQLTSLSPHGFHRVVFYEWGNADNPSVVMCAHGVGRNGRDFDVLGESLATTHRVLAVDMPGRGERTSISSCATPCWRATSISPAG